MQSGVRGRSGSACREPANPERTGTAKAAPGTINYASGPIGASNHVAAEAFEAMAGVELTRIGYKGGGPAVNDVPAGQVKVMFATTGSVTGEAPEGSTQGSFS